MVWRIAIQSPSCRRPAVKRREPSQGSSAIAGIGWVGEASSRRQGAKRINGLSFSGKGESNHIRLRGKLLQCTHVHQQRVQQRA